jgi:hypothetical protein
MVKLTYDEAALAFVTSGSEGEGAVMFKGWLGPTGSPPVSEEVAEKVRFYTDPQFLDWLEIHRADVLYQATAAADDPGGASVIWIKREARIRRSQAGRAYWFDQVMAETADDPTARHPRPPH